MSGLMSLFVEIIAGTAGSANPFLAMVPSLGGS
jgi:hypothetical protein